MDKKANLVIRYFTLVLGIYIMTLGATLAMKGSIGVCPLDAIIISFADITNMSIGNFNIIFNLIFVFAQVAVLRREYKPLQLLQFPISFIFGWFVDINLKYVWVMAVDGGYAMKVICVVMGMVIEAVGINFVLQSNVVMTPIDGFYYVLGKKMNKSTGTMRIFLDLSLLIINVVLILTITNNWTIREGTIISLAVLGPCIDLFRKPVSIVMKKLDNTL